MKKFITLLFATSLLITPVIAKTDKMSQDYLQNKKHFAIMNPIAENIAERVIRSALKKETGAKFKVKFEGYTLSSMKKGVFKDLQITGKDVSVDGIEVPYIKLNTLTDYNWVDYTQDPIVFKSDMTFAYEMELSEKTINDALKNKEYKKIIQNVNKRAYPLFTVNNVRVKVKNSKIHLMIEYNFPIMAAKQNKTFVVSTGFHVANGKIQAKNVGIDSVYGNLPIDKVTNLINLLNPLSFTLSLLDSKQCNAKIENVNIVDNVVKIDGKIFVKGD